VAFERTDDLPRTGVAVDEWVFAAWTPDAAIGVLSGHRLVAGRAWYWTALVERGHPLLLLTEWEVARRADPFVVKAPEMWAEHHCVEPLVQWSIGNEGYAVALDDPDEGLGRAYGVPTAMAFDLEWYAIGGPVACDGGFEQAGVVHGEIELLDRPPVSLSEIPAHRWRRWSTESDLAPVRLEPVVAHTGLRATVAFPDGSRIDWVLLSSGWHARAAAS
jgi:hypothetical protein